MTEETNADRARSDADAGQKLDKLLSHLDSFAGRMDSFARRMDAMEAMDKARKDAEEKEKSGREDKARKDKARADKEEHDKWAKDDAEGCAKDDAVSGWPWLQFDGRARG